MTAGGGPPGLPPGPRSRLTSSVSYALRPYQLHARARQRYGDPFTLRTFAGAFVVTGSPRGVKAMFGVSPDLYEPAILDSLRVFVPPHSMQLLKGERHTRERSLMSPMFTGERMRDYGEMIESLADQRFSKIVQGREFNPDPVCRALSLDVMLEAVFGVRGAEFRTAMAERILAFAAAIKPSILFFSFLRRELAGRGPWARYQRALEAVDTALYGEILRARNGAAGDDILSQMTRVVDDRGMGLSDEELRDEILTLVFAGHETTGIAMAWALFWLGQHPSLQTRLLCELREAAASVGLRAAVNDVRGLPLLTAVCYEALRLNPIPADITRRLTRDHEFLGYRLPAGTVLTASPYLLHMDEATYPDPTLFQPERFLGRRPRPHEFLAFGGGNHRCLGAAFAIYEMRVVLARLLSQFRIEHVSKQPVEARRHTIVLGPSDRLRVRLIAHGETAKHGSSIRQVA